MRHLSVCAFCLKYVCGGGGISGGGGGDGGILQRHLILLERIVRIKCNQRRRNNLKEFSYYFCDDCASILDSLVQCYDQMKVMELRVEWNLWKLQKIAGFADRAPSRLAAATKLHTGAERVEELELIREWRNVFLMKCTQKLATRLPKVSLAKCQIHQQKLSQSSSSQSSTTEEVGDEEEGGTGHHTEIDTTTCLVSDDAKGVDVHVHQEFLISSDSKFQQADDVDDVPPSFDDDLEVGSQDVASLVAGMDPPSPDLENSFVESSTQELKRDPGSPPPPVSLHADADDDDNDRGDNFSQRDDCRVESPPAAASLPHHNSTSPKVSNRPEGPRLKRIQKDIKSAQKPATDDSSRLRARHRCSKCSKTCSTASKLKIHENMSCHLSEKIENCDDDEEEEEHQADSDFEPKAETEEEEEEFENDMKGEVEGEANEKKSLRPNPTIKKSRMIKLRTCTICQRGIRGSSNYQRHFMQNHKIEGVEPTQIQRCELDQCSAYFLTVAQLKTHLVLEHKQIIPQKHKYSTFFNFEVDSACKSCQKVFLTPGLMSEHSKVFHEVDAAGSSAGKVFNCEVTGCSTHCPSAALLEEHMERVHQTDLAPSVVPSLSAPATGVLPPSFLEEASGDVGSRTCTVCQLVFKTISSHNQHFRISHELTGLEGEGEVKRCGEDQCAAYFRTEHQLSLHMIRSHRKFRAQVDDHAPPQFPEDDEGLRVGDGAEDAKTKDNKSKKWASKKRLYCPVCPRWYFDNKSRSEHFKHWHDLSLTSSPGIRCDQPFCSAYFVSRTQLGSHLEEAHQLKDPTTTTCSTCGKYFPYRWQLKDHRDRTHDKHLLAATHVCTWPGCGKTFTLDKARRKHEWWVHTPKKKGNRKKKSVASLVCDLCGKTFGRAANLELHKLTHSGPDSYPFQCATCGKKFINKGSLERHSRTHSQEKPYVCHYCGKGFAHDNLRRHIRMNHADAADPPPPPSGRP